MAKRKYVVLNTSLIQKILTDSKADREKVPTATGPEDGGTRVLSRGYLERAIEKAKEIQGQVVVISSRKKFFSFDEWWQEELEKAGGRLFAQGEDDDCYDRFRQGTLDAYKRAFKYMGIPWPDHDGIRDALAEAHAKGCFLNHFDLKEG